MSDAEKMRSSRDQPPIALPARPLSAERDWLAYPHGARLVVMERKMLLTIRDHAERLARAPATGGRLEREHDPGGLARIGRDQRKGGAQARWKTPELSRNSRPASRLT